MTIINSQSLILDPSQTRLDPVAQLYAVTPCRSRYVSCHNLASARSYSTGRLPNKVDTVSEARINVQAFVSPTGQYYVMHGNQRMDVANASTARHYVKHGVAVSTMISAALSTLNQ